MHVHVHLFYVIACHALYWLETRERGREREREREIDRERGGGGGERGEDSGDGFASQTYHAYDTCLHH